MPAIMTDPRHYSDIADAIRCVTMTSGGIKPSEMAGMIRDIKGGYDAIATGDVVGRVYGSAAMIRPSAFYGMSYITEAHFPKCAVIGENAFGRCPMLSEVNVESCTQMSRFAFASCARLGSIDMGACVRIESYAFFDCQRLSEVTLPKCASIGSYAFANCRSLASVDLTGVSAVPQIGQSAFATTPIGGAYQPFGSIYVAESLYGSFLADAGWASVSSRIVSIPS